MGGAVYVENKDTTLTNCDFINCTASSNSAILYNKPQQGSQAVTILAIGNTIENCSPANDLYSTNDYVTLITKITLLKYLQIKLYSKKIQI